VENTGITYTEFWDMPVEVRRFYLDRKIQEREKEARNPR